MSIAAVFCLCGHKLPSALLESDETASNKYTKKLNAVVCVTDLLEIFLLSY